MFVYENGNSLNLTFKGSIPVENPEVIIKGFENGASLTVNGTELVSVADAKEFEGKAKTFVFQSSDKLMITFKGIEGIEEPEVVLDEPVKGTVNVVVNGTAVVLNYDEEKVTVGSEVAEVEEPTLIVEETPAEEPQVTEPEVIEDEPEEVVEE